jgi:hypothetical protein
VTCFLLGMFYNKEMLSCHNSNISLHSMFNQHKISEFVGDTKFHTCRCKNPAATKFLACRLMLCFMLLLEDDLRFNHVAYYIMMLSCLQIVKLGLCMEQRFTDFPKM